MAGFFKRWKQGIKDLPATSLLRAKLYSNAGMIASIIFASVYLLIANFWYVLGIMIFSLITQVIEFVGNYKMYMMSRQSEVLIENAKKAALQFNQGGGFV